MWVYFGDTNSNNNKKQPHHISALWMPTVIWQPAYSVIYFLVSHENYVVKRDRLTRLPTSPCGIFLITQAHIIAWSVELALMAMSKDLAYTRYMYVVSTEFQILCKGTKVYVRLKCCLR